MITKGINEGFQDTDLKQGIVSGYFAMFGNKDLDGDIIEKGAFTKTIQERGPNGKGLIKYLLDHDRYKAVAKITALEEDYKGLRYTAKIGTHALGQDFVKMVESELINQHSFGFVTVKEMYDSQAKANRIKEVMMHEGSAIQFLGANPETTYIDLKSPVEIMAEIARFELFIEKMKKFAKNSDATDETIILIEKTINNLIEINLKSLTALLKPTEVTSNDKGADLDSKTIIETLKKTFENHGRITT